MRRELYDTYVEFKGWTGEEATVDIDSYLAEVSRAGVSAPARVLEIGFGEGHFMDWARSAGYSVTGVELIDELVGQCGKRGHTVFSGTPQEAIDPAAQSFDLIVAFHVFEHQTLEELADLLRFCEKILSPGGKILAQFPNGGSPFSRLYQNGDITHVIALTENSLKQIAGMVGLVCDGAFNGARSMRSGQRHWLFKKAAYTFRDVIETVVGNAYYGRRVPMDPNLSVILSRR